MEEKFEEKMSQMMSQLMSQMSTLTERIDALERGKSINESPGHEDELHLNSVMFGNETGIPRRRSLLPTGEFRQQHVPSFKANLTGELTMAKAFAFKMETEKYMRYNTDALLQ
jgi:hypothetical protein